jgi:hypothetical protein
MLLPLLEGGEGVNCYYVHCTLALTMCAGERGNHLCGANGRKNIVEKRTLIGESGKIPSNVQRQRARSEMRDDIYANCAGLMKYSLSHSPFFLSFSFSPSIHLSRPFTSPTIFIRYSQTENSFNIFQLNIFFV